MPDYGSARCDFPGGDPGELWDSTQRIDRMPDATRLFVCDDYLPNGRPLAYEATVAEPKCRNVQVCADTERSAYVAFRRAKDATLETPALLLPALQVNIRAGELPEPEADGRPFLKIPIDAIGGAP